MTLRRQIALLTTAELRSEWRSAEVATIVIPFGAVALLVIPMAIGIETALLSRLGPGLFWVVVLLFGLTVTQRHTASVGRPHREVLQLLGLDPAARFAATAITSGVFVLGFELVVGAVMIFLYDPAAHRWAWALAVLPLVAAGIAMMGTLAAGLARGLGTRTSLAPLLAAPLAVPILLAAAQATEGLGRGAGILRWMLMLALVDVLLAITGVLTARPLEEASA